MKDETGKSINNTASNHARADRLEIIFYTDPLCCWSWVMEPQWRLLVFRLQHSISYRYVMGGLLPSWKNFNDPMLAVSRPIQMGPVWMEASLQTGMSVYDKIWVEDPPPSSYPACIAVKSAGLQSKPAGDKYLRYLREAVMLQGKNIADLNILLDVANLLSIDNPGLLNVKQFSADLTNGIGLEAFRNDLNDVQSKGINRFPTLIMRNPAHKALLLTGYRPYTALWEAAQHLAPGLKSYAVPFTVSGYQQYWGHLSAQEEEIINRINIS